VTLVLEGEETHRAEPGPCWCSFMHFGSERMLPAKLQHHWLWVSSGT